MKELKAESYAHQAFRQHGMTPPGQRSNWGRRYVGDWINKDRAAGIAIDLRAEAYAKGWRARAGLAAAKSGDKVPGRPRRMKPADVVRTRKLLDAGEMNSQDVANVLKVSLATMFRELRNVRDLKAIETGR